MTVQLTAFFAKLYSVGFTAAANYKRFQLSVHVSADSSLETVTWGEDQIYSVDHDEVCNRNRSCRSRAGLIADLVVKSAPSSPKEYRPGYDSRVEWDDDGDGD